MNSKTIQSNSYRGYSKSLLEIWISYFNDRPQNEMNFLEKNIQQCLIEFRIFASAYESKAKDIAIQQTDFMNQHASRLENYQIWLNERISKALDVYWAPVSQAATQYTSPAYKAHLDDLLKKQNLQLKLEGYLNQINELSGNTGAGALTLNDVVLFFDELTLIRLQPYTKLGFIGIPFRVFDSAASSIDEMLAGIAHELGHLLYWHLAEFDQIGTKQKDIINTISESLKSEPYNHDEQEIRFVKSWIEELFADFVGAKIAGDMYVKSCKDMVIRNNKSSLSLSDNDQSHVPDSLRPLISIYAASNNRTEAKNSWKTFFNESFSTDLSTMEILSFRDNNKTRDIKRSPDELSQIVLDTVDIFASEIGKGEERGLLNFNFTARTDASGLAQKATRLAKDQFTLSATDLDLFLNPIILEAEAQSHTHNAKTDASSHHQGANKTFTHTH